MNTLIIPTPRVLYHRPFIGSRDFRPHFTASVDMCWINGRPESAMTCSGATRKDAKRNLWNAMRRTFGVDLKCIVNDKHDAPHPLK